MVDNLRSRVNTPFGTIRFEYSVNGDSVRYKLFVPFGTQAEIVIHSDKKRVILNEKDTKITESRMLVEGGTYDIRFLR